IGLYDPLVALPAIVFRHDPQLMMNMILSLHVALFSLGGWFMASALRAPGWARLTAAISLCFSGFFFVWGGNWSTIVIPHTFLPWTIGSILRLLDSSDKRQLFLYEVLLGASVLGLFMTGLLFAAYFGALAILSLVAYILVKDPQVLKTLVWRLLPQCLLFSAVVIPFLIGQRELYEYLGSRENEPFHWILFAVPLQAYLGLLLPNTYSIWQGPFYPNGIPISNILMMCGIVPAWYLLLVSIRSPLLFAQRTAIPLLVGLGVMVVFLSPNAFDLEEFFSKIPILSAFRWPFRGIPAFHTLFVFLFLVIACESRTFFKLNRETLVPVLCALTCVISLALELNLASVRSPVKSWYRAAPMLDDPETWTKPTLDALKTSGYVINVCRSEAFFHAKPRIFLYGNLGSEYGISTVHLYSAPRPRQYAPLGMSIKGCITNLEGVRRMVEKGPQRPLDRPAKWERPLGPKDFDEIVAKTYVGAAIVENGYTAPLEYFLNSDKWQVLEKRNIATAFVRKR
ncbi:MAG TPA: hypothetical protein VK463_10255, partial [Desulfomonilaceae bacterium]|nr:hypothetical protein [Desulfomonilaceae bacterium]